MPDPDKNLSTLPPAEHPDTRKILFVCDSFCDNAKYIRAFIEKHHRVLIQTDTDRAISEFYRKPFKFDAVVINLPEGKMADE
jgi:hypothetical protein